MKSKVFLSAVLLIMVFITSCKTGPEQIEPLRYDSPLQRIGERNSHPSSDTPRTIELIRDRHFQNGFKVLDPASFKRVVRGFLQWDGSKDEPVWDIAQWNSKYSLASVSLEQLASGAVRFANVAKTVVVGLAGSEEADLILAVDSRPEYGDRVRRVGEPWPHLLVQQRIVGCPALTELKELPFQIEARLRYSQRFETPEYTAKLHCAQFPFVLIVQNLNRNSPGYGDFLWFQVPIYDDRWRIPPRYVAEDTADPSAKLIYNPGGDAYTTESLHDGQWVTIQQDLLPLILESLRTAWVRGYLKDSHDFSDYRIAEMNMGWEVTGINKTEIQVRNLSLKAIRKK